MEGAELIDTTSNAMDRLLQYLDSNLATLHDNLNEDNFNRVLLVIWEIISETLYELVNTNLEVNVKDIFFSYHKEFQCFIKLLFTETTATSILLKLA